MKFDFRQYARISVILGLSLLIHLAILYALTWKVAGSGSQGSGQPLTVTIARLAPEGQAGPAEDKKPAGEDQALPKTAKEHYFSLTELERRPVLNSPDLPDHPQQGEVIFRLWVDNTGKVTRIEPVTPELSQTFIAGARAHFFNLRFMPTQSANGTKTIDITLRYDQPE